MWRILDFDSACFCAGKRIRRAKVMENTQDYQDYQDYRAEILGIVRSNASPGIMRNKLEDYSKYIPNFVL